MHLVIMHASLDTQVSLSLIFLSTGKYAYNVRGPAPVPLSTEVFGVGPIGHIVSYEALRVPRNTNFPCK